MHNLILTVSGRQAAQFGPAAQMVFVQGGGSLGRSDECDWVLPASGVSRTHAVVRYLNGMYFIEDCSTNGLLLNGQMLVRGEPAALGDGDRLQLDSFEIDVRLQSVGPSPMPLVGADAGNPDLTQVVVAAPTRREDAPALEDPFDVLWGRASGATPAAVGAGMEDLGVAPPDELDPLRLLPSSAVVQAAVRSDADAWHHAAASHDHFRPPAPVQATQRLPDDWDLTLGDFSAAAPSVPAAAPARTPGGAMPEDLDRVFVIVVEGVMDVLRARAEIKNTFRLPVTVIQRSENNPLKFAATTQEAMQKLSAPAGGAFLSGAAAFDDAFDDIRCHQMAMLAGMRAAYEAMLFHFSPDRIEQEADGNGRRLAFAGKGRYWDRYRENFQRMVKDPDDCFRRLFGDEFARAYETQLARYRSSRSSGGPRPG
ncbi:type VI secretion system-associated FHA domain protein TagH [Stenotrophomonas sp. RAC2]|uniref:type VI secretion system-associated FHA domain protein TagH n=1 Tax=Stenotrophomonas sp. RAC2 TaxID=3064902 RepID=UPI00271846EE|nr:type VI secretion system-associated FHA domain protein TagH [Stenotrophomonas sp. RAC2]MDV9040830.1 type VI secretion system-associated FHA domain protein TagH [Stenotrophomonas sp. RAC2]